MPLDAGDLTKNRTAVRVITCPTCGKQFTRTTKHPKQRFCSRDCYKLSCRKFETRAYPQIWYKGKRELLHRVIYMQHTGETLTADDIVHHKDENPFNRDISNLQKLTGDARRLHLEIHRPSFRRRNYARLVDDECPF